MAMLKRCETKTRKTYRDDLPKAVLTTQLIAKATGDILLERDGQWSLASMWRWYWRERRLKRQVELNNRRLARNQHSLAGPTISFPLSGGHSMEVRISRKCSDAEFDSLIKVIRMARPSFIDDSVKGGATLG